jgi:hypothetical protein
MRISMIGDTHSINAKAVSLLKLYLVLGHGLYVEPTPWE